MGLKVHGPPQDWMGSYQNSLSLTEHASVLRMGFECRFTSRHAFARQQPADAAVPNSREPASATSDSRNAAGVGHCTNALSHSSQIMKFLVCRKGEASHPAGSSCGLCLGRQLHPRMPAVDTSGATRHHCQRNCRRDRPGYHRQTLHSMPQAEAAKTRRTRGLMPLKLPFTTALSPLLPHSCTHHGAERSMAKGSKASVYAVCIGVVSRMLTRTAEGLSTAINQAGAVGVKGLQRISCSAASDGFRYVDL